MAEGHFGVLKCAYGSHEEFLVLLISRVLIIRSDENPVSMLFVHTLAPLVFGRHHHYDRKFPFLSLIINFPDLPIFSSRIPIIKRQCCIAGNFRQRKNSSIATARQFVTNIFLSSAGRHSSALRSFNCRCLACRLFSHS